MLVDGLGEQHCGDLEILGNGFKDDFLVHLGYFLPCASLSHASRTL